MNHLHQTLILGVIVERAGEVVMAERTEVFIWYLGFLKFFKRGDNDLLWGGRGATYAEDDKGWDVAVLCVQPSSTTVFSTTFVSRMTSRGIVNTHIGSLGRGCRLSSSWRGTTRLGGWRGWFRRCIRDFRLRCWVRRGRLGSGGNRLSLGGYWGCLSRVHSGFVLLRFCFTPLREDFELGVVFQIMLLQLGRRCSTCGRFCLSLPRLR